MGHDEDSMSFTKTRSEKKKEMDFINSSMSTDDSDFNSYRSEDDEYDRKKKKRQEIKKRKN